MNQMPKISIIVPTYNTGDKIERLLDALMRQSYKNIEIIIVNDGSTDQTIPYVHRYRNDNRLILINQENKGVSGARNSGLRESTGEYITFIDSDDYINHDYINEMVKAANPCTLCITSFCMNDVIIYPPKNLSNKQEVITYFMRRWSVCGILFPRRMLLSAEFDENVQIAEDLKFIAAILMNNRFVKLAACDKAVYYYVKNYGSAMNSKYSHKYLTGLFTEIDVYDCLNKNGFYNPEMFIILNGLYQAASRYVKLRREERKKYSDDFKSIRNHAKKYSKLVQQNKTFNRKKKIVIYLTAYCPNLLILAESLRKNNDRKVK